MYQKDKIKRGAKVRVKSMEGMYEGVVKYWNPNTEELTIEPGYCLRLKRNIADDFNFYKNDIESITVLEELEPEVEQEPELSSSSTSEEKSSYTASLENDFNNNNNASNNINHHSFNNTQKSTILDTIKTYPHLLISDSCSAISVLKSIIKNRFKEIGLKLYGDLTRRGYISLLCLHADEYVYLIDFLSIKNEEDENESEIIDLLNDILADSSIVKVMHNSAFASDILFHQNHVNLRNVFDVMVAYNKIYSETYGKNPNHEIDIELLINQNLPNVELSHSINDYKNIDWRKRPLNSINKYVALRETAYLIDLYNVFYCKMFEKFNKGCDLILTIVKNSQNEEKNRNLYQNAALLNKELQTLFTIQKETDCDRKQNRSFNMKHDNKQNDFRKKLNGIFKTSTDIETDDDQYTLQNNTNVDSSISETNFQNKYLNNNVNNNNTNISDLFTRPVESRELSKKYNLKPAGMLKIVSPKSKK